MMKNGLSGTATGAKKTVPFVTEGGVFGILRVGRSGEIPIVPIIKIIHIKVVIVYPIFRLNE